MQKIKNLIIYLSNLPFFYLMYFIKPKKNLWVFGAWMGEKYFDNPKYLFEYIQSNHKNIKVIWITKEKKICDGDIFIYKYSLKGFYCALFGEIFLVTHSTNSDIYNFINNRTRKTVQLWHGIPIKKIGLDDSFSKKDSNIKNKIFPFLNHSYSLVISSSEIDRVNMRSAFNIENTQVTGYPRNDILLKHNNKQDQYKILYAPTLRDNINDEVNLFDDYNFNIETIVQLLEKYDLYLDIKMHPANVIDINFKASMNNKRINFLESKIEINEIINNYSILISDYSGIYVDYLLLDKPIIFTPFDYEKYITKDRELYYDYDEVTPGPKCKDWNEVLVWIEKFKNDSKLYASERKIVKDKFHKYIDGKNCERVYNEILSMRNIFEN